MKLTRRQVVVMGAAAVLSGVSGCGRDGGSSSSGGGGTCSKDTKSITVSVGRQPFAAGNSPITEYMKENQTFEKMAEKLCYDVTVNYKDFPAAAPMVPAMIAGRLDFGMWGDTPTLTAVAQKQPLTIISVGEGHLRFLVATRKGSGITNLEGLKGKTVGVLLGGDPELAFLGMLKGVLGTSDTKALGIKMVNIPTQAAAATIPKGVDAAVVIYPALLKQQEKDKNVVAIANSYGLTEPGYDGKLGQGAGKAFPGAKDSPFAPEGFYTHRSMWLTRDALIKKDPAVVAAFLAAEQEACAALTKTDPGKVSDMVKKYWRLTPQDGAKVVKDELVFRRGFTWATHGDAVDLLKLSKVMAANKVIKAPLTWDELTANLAKGAAVTKQAYQASGSDPGPSHFKATSDDARGAPSWDVKKWEAPSGQ